jgi:hypothetical protein
LAAAGGVLVPAVTHIGSRCRGVRRWQSAPVPDHSVAHHRLDEHCLRPITIAVRSARDGAEAATRPSSGSYGRLGERRHRTGERPDGAVPDPGPHVDDPQGSSTGPRQIRYDPDAARCRHLPLVRSRADDRPPSCPSSAAPHRGGAPDEQVKMPELDPLGVLFTAQLGDLQCSRSLALQVGQVAGVPRHVIAVLPAVST